MNDCAVDSKHAITVRRAGEGVEFMHATYRGHAFALHRHATYAIGITSLGVQAFRYRGEARHSLTGQAFVLHPDEPHDGRAGVGDTFGYRIAYIAPNLLRKAAGLRSIPFLRAPISADEDLVAAVTMVLMGAGDSSVDELDLVSALSSLGRVLANKCGAAGAETVTALDGPRLTRVLARLNSDPASRLNLVELEAISGLTRWELARRFRAAAGVSLSQYHIWRRLEFARRLMMRRFALADIAAAAGFADQAHLTRRFKSAYGVTPGQWRAMLAVR